MKKSFKHNNKLNKLQKNKNKKNNKLLKNKNKKNKLLNNPYLIIMMKMINLKKIKLMKMIKLNNNQFQNYLILNLFMNKLMIYILIYTKYKILNGNLKK